MKDSWYLMNITEEVWKSQNFTFWKKLQESNPCIIFSVPFYEWMQSSVTIFGKEAHPPALPPHHPFLVLSFNFL
jgi:hypothetical protein